MLCRVHAWRSDRINEYNFMHSRELHNLHCYRRASRVVTERRGYSVFAVANYELWLFIYDFNAYCTRTRAHMRLSRALHAIRARRDECEPIVQPSVFMLNYPSFHLCHCTDSIADSSASPAHFRMGVSEWVWVLLCSHLDFSVSMR